jgi:alkanesulfonate monooxygenase SsuD/methylene tetrahydromethanopterin reductase-like flavin-dependent oxidoreductase (luciferase family)
MRVDVILGAGLPAAAVEALGVTAERYGVHTVWVQSFPSRRDPWMTIAGLGSRTARVRLGVMPISPYEVHPLRIADALYTLNDLSAGRAAVLVGGLGKSVARVTGLAPTRRITAVRDCVRILKGVSASASLEYTGEVYRLKHYHPEWATQAPPLVYVGSTGAQMLAMAGAEADGVMMSDVPLARMDEVLGHLRRGFARAGRDGRNFRVNNFMAWHIGVDREANLRQARQELVWRGLLQRWHLAGFLPEDEVALVETKFDSFLQAFYRRSDEIEGVPRPLVDRLVEHLTFAGGLDDVPRVAGELRRYEAAGLNEVALKVHGDPAAALTVIGERLLPLLH